MLGLVGSLLGSALGAAASGALARARAASPDGSAAFPLDSTRRCSLATALSPASPACSRRSRRRCAPRGSIPWWRSVADDDPPAARACASPTTSARRSRPRCCTASTCALGAASSCALIGPLGLGQEHAAQHRRPARPADARALVHRGQGHRPARRARASTRLRGRSIGFVFQFHHLSAGLHRARERHDADAGRRGRPDAAMRERARRAARTRSASAMSLTTGSTISPAASSSAWRSPARSR